MKYSLALVAFMGLSLNQGDVNAIKITKETVPSTEGRLTCRADGAQKTDLPGLYDDESAVNNLDGEAALNALTKGPMVDGHPEFVVAYHPQCADCHHMVDDFKKVAVHVKVKGLKLNVIAVNMSKTGKYANDLKIEGFPTIRFYDSPGNYKEFDGRIAGTDYDGFVQFLKKEGIAWA